MLKITVIEKPADGVGDHGRTCNCGSKTGGPPCNTNMCKVQPSTSLSNVDSTIDLESPLR